MNVILFRPLLAIRKAAVVLVLPLAACGLLPQPMQTRPEPVVAVSPVQQPVLGHEVVLFALGLVDTGYRFGGKNPDAGLDCSGMVSYIYREATNLNLTGSASSIARAGRNISQQSLRPGDLVFFNTQQKPRSHVGIYIGEGRFVHAPSSQGKVRVDRMDNRYYASRFEEARTYFD